MPVFQFAHRACLAFGLSLCGLATSPLGAQTDGPDRNATVHWAYVKPARPTVPRAGEAAGSRNPIDGFVWARLAAEELSPTPVAEPARLLRRVYLDLTGLPPSIAELDAFLRDDSPTAYQDVVDRLLASPRYGEHWARHWLDLARYADSNGFQADQLRESWAYRDWVIEAINRDLPYDRFTIEQLAGDLLPGATLEQRIATGFHRTVTCNVEAGVDPEENRVNQVFDRVDTTGTVWLGSTIECAQCHDHKYDPFSQRDYYRLFAFFNNTPLEVRNPLGKGVRFDFWGPSLELPMPADKVAQRESLQARHDELRAHLAAEQTDARFAAWQRSVLEALEEPPRWHPLAVSAFDSTGDEDVTFLDDGSVLIGGRVPGTATYTVRVATELTGIAAFKLETLTHPSLPGTGPGRGDDARPNFILSEFSVTSTAPQGSGSTAPIALHDAHADHSQDRWNVRAAIDGDPRTGWAIGGGFFADHWATFRTREPAGTLGGATLTFTLDQNFGRGRTIGRFRLSALTGNAAALHVPEPVLELVRRGGATAAQTKRLRRHFETNQPTISRLAQQIAEVREQLDAIAPPTTLVMVELDEPRATHVLRRGSHLDPGEPVDAGTPGALHAWNESWPRNRLGLARWIVDPDNPLTARVAVNRWWSQFFGRGLVGSEEDFGTRAEPPSHPRLLDWLATELIASRWSMKHVHRLIVTSATYRRSSNCTPALLERDPDNRLLARGPRFRMPAEMIRDTGLTISGLLSDARGGPPVFPPQPPNLWRQTGRNEPKYVAATDHDRFRRGVYVVWRRAAPYPSFVNFDGPDRATCHPMRSRTNTPLQALTLMNDEASLEMALALAERMLTAGAATTATERIIHGFRRAVARAPQPAELDELADVLEREMARFAADPAAADRLVDAITGYRPPAHLPRAQLAAWFFVATILLNLDETITKG